MNKRQGTNSQNITPKRKRTNDNGNTEIPKTRRNIINRLTESYKENHVELSREALIRTFELFAEDLVIPGLDAYGNHIPDYEISDPPTDIKFSIQAELIDEQTGDLITYTVSAPEESEKQLDYVRDNMRWLILDQAEKEGKNLAVLEESNYDDDVPKLYTESLRISPDDVTFDNPLIIIWADKALRELVTHHIQNGTTLYAPSFCYIHKGNLLTAQIEIGICNTCNTCNKGDITRYE